MDPNCNPGPPPRQKIPKDGMGTRGFPDCYYTSRVLNSTFRYARFIKRLRAREAEEQTGIENMLKDSKDGRRNEFFGRSDRRSLIQQVAYRVDLCMAAYEEDLNKRRSKLLAILTDEEEMNMRKFVEEAQRGSELIWQAKKDRLAYLLNKRQQEHEAKHSETHLSKATLLHPCLVQMRTRESKEYQQYQIREKQMRREAEKEMDRMWHEVAMKGAEALDARMEYDAIEDVRRKNECTQYNNKLLELKRIQREKDRQMLKQQVLQRKQHMEEHNRKKDEEKRASQEKQTRTDQMLKEMRKEREDTVAKQEAEAKLVNDTWDKFTTQRANEEKLKEELIRQKKKDLDVCNDKMAELKHNIAVVKDNNEGLILQEGARLRDIVDLKRCQYTKWSQRNKIAEAAANKKTYLERKEEEAKEGAESREYSIQMKRQLDELVKHKELTDAQARKLYQKDLVQQVAYNNLLKERARKEDLEEIQKSEIATREYLDEMREMLGRKYFSDEVHPFMKQMASGLEIKKCLCTLPNYCADAKPEPEDEN